MQVETQGPANYKDRVERLLPYIYLVVAFFVCILLSLLTPPLLTPDGCNHAQRGLQIAHGQWIPLNSPAGAGGVVGSNMLLFVSSIEKIAARDTDVVHTQGARADGRISDAELESLQRIRWARTVRYSVFANTGVYAPVLYFPAAAGWRLGQAFDLTILHSLFLVRWFNLLFAIAIGWAALRAAGRERWILFAILLVPTLLSLEASSSQDALITPLLALSIALVLRATASQRRLTNLELLIATTALAVTIAAKPPYLPVALLLLLPPLESGEIRSRKTIPSLVCIAIIAAFTMGWQALVHPFKVALFNGAVPAEQTAFLKAHSVHVSLVLLKATVSAVPIMVAGGLSVLGSNNAIPSKLVLRLTLLSLVMIFLMGPHVRLQRRSSLVLLLIVLCSIVGGLSLAGYIFWTAPMAGIVDGLQSRYYLPLAPVAIVLASAAVHKLARLKLVEWGRVRQRALLISAGLFLTLIMYTPWLAAHRFYRLGLGAALHEVVR